MRHALAISALAMLLPACSILPNANSEPPRKYVLPVLDPSFVQAPAFQSCHVVIDLPTLYPPIDTTRIALKPQEQLIDYYADAEWANRLSVLIQESLIYSLQNKNVFQGVSRPAEGIQGDYAIKIEVRKFYIDQPYDPLLRTAQVDYMVSLVKLPGRRIIASKTFSFIHTVPENNMEDIIKSLGKAHSQAMESLITWAARSIPSLKKEK